MANRFNDDELDSIPTSKASAVANKVVAQTAVDDDDAVDLIGDADRLKASPVLANIAPKQPNQIVRFALIPGMKGFMKNTHFLQSVGRGMTVLCPGEGCPECAKGGSEHGARRKIVCLVLKYETSSNDGKFPPGVTRPTVSIGYLGLSPTSYGELRESPSEGEDLFDCDFKISRKTNGIGLTIGRMSSPPAYKKANMQDEVNELAKPYLDGVTLKSRLGKPVTTHELKAMLAGVSGVESAAATLDDIDSI